MPRGSEAMPRHWTYVHTGSVVVSALTCQSRLLSRGRHIRCGGGILWNFYSIVEMLH